MPTSRKPTGKSTPRSTATPAKRAAASGANPAPRSIAELDLVALARERREDCHPSPPAWEDEVLYFLMLDRFSDGNETGYTDNEGNPVTTGSTTMYTPGSPEIGEDEKAAWREAGKDWTGGNLKGLEGKLGYLKRMGVTAVWISPLFKQVEWSDTYHGYGVQNFLGVDRRFGSPEELRQLVKTAHDMEIRVILDIILNHGGDVFAYQDGEPGWNGGTFDASGFRDKSGAPSLPFEPGAANAVGWPDGAAWPAELQAPGTFTRKGRIGDMDHDPQYREGDFFSLKDIRLGSGPGDAYAPSAALRAICDAYKFWIAYADLDGYRVDTVKHMDPGAARYMASSLHEFAQSIGKENFYLIGEIVGSRNQAVERMESVGLDAALGINESMYKMEGMLKGQEHPEAFFGLFRNAEAVGQNSHTWFRDRVVTMFDDHDQALMRDKMRFCAPGAWGVESPHPDYLKMLPAALALNLTTLGIPCIYYGSEQGFDGQGFKSDEGFEDRYIRECMFGGPFGAFRSSGWHFFDDSHPAYRSMSQVTQLRADHMALRRGRQYLRQISGDGVNFGFPHKMGDGPMRSVVPWSRIFNDREYLLAINTDPDQPRTTWVVVDAHLNPPGSSLTCMYSSAAGVAGSTEVVKDAPGGGSVVQLTVPPAGFVVYRQT